MRRNGDPTRRALDPRGTGTTNRAFSMAGDCFDIMASQLDAAVASRIAHSCGGILATAITPLEVGTGPKEARCLQASVLLATAGAALVHSGLQAAEGWHAIGTAAHRDSGNQKTLQGVKF